MAKVRGASLLGVVRVLRRNRERAEALLAEPLHDYLGTALVPEAWYPLEDQLGLLRGLEEIVKPPSGAELWAMMGRITAREHLGGGGGLPGGEPGSREALRRAAALWQAQFDHGRLELAFPEAGEAELELLGFALPSTELCGMLAGYVAESFEGGGARAVQVEERECRARGAERCRWRIRWEPPAEGGGEAA